jgi:alkylation response protein AidB-like acyl-CoA dehydrogenase
MAQAALRLTARHAGERIAFGKPLTAQQAVAHKLVEVRRRNEAARHLTYHAARLRDAGEDARAAAMLAKIEAIDAAVLAADEGVQIHGGYGYVVEYHVERYYRDAKTLEVLEGGIEFLRDQLAAMAV